MEQSFVAWAKMRARKLPPVKLGIGDDAALMESRDGDFVLTTDTLMEGVHFESGKVALERIGKKLVAVNLSDLAAMGADPIAIFLSFCIPQNSDRAADVIAAEIYEGVCQAAEKYQVGLAGGDTNCWDGPLVLNMTAVGRTVDNIVWKRSGVQAEDLIVVTGPLGGSILGKHLDFEPRLDLVKKLRGNIDIHAAMDISDGLSVDLLRMSDASNCGAILDLEQIPITAAAHQLSEQSDKTPVEHALGDGEDFELLLAIAPSDLPRLQELVGADQAIVCGTFTSRTGLWARDGGKLRQLPSTGYVHGF